MVGHAVIVRGRYCALIKRRKHYERFDIQQPTSVLTASRKRVNATLSRRKLRYRS